MRAAAEYRVLEGFAGPGGWSEALRMACAALGLDIGPSLGVEWDASACETAIANGHDRVCTDVSMFDLRPFVGSVVGAILSPPCQSFSAAGKGLGKLDRPRIEAHVRRVLAAGRWLHYSREGWHDDRSPLVLEPLRWVLTLRPRWVALEQVPAVLPLWELMAEVFASVGYSTATGVLSAEEFGVPQTRKRAILVAALDVDVALPSPTHRAYRKGRARAEGDPALLPWVSMADALGWAPGGVAGFPRRADSDDVVTLDGVDYRARDLRPTELPAQALTEKVRSWLATGTRPNSTRRRVDDEPAPTLAPGHDAASHVWMGEEPTPEATKAAKLPPGDAVRFGNQPHSAVRAIDEPAATVRYSERMNACDWISEEAAAGTSSTMVDPRPVSEPAGSVTGKATAEWGERVTRAAGPRECDAKAVRVSVSEAAVLQSFRADYVWCGTKTAQYRQVGDAVPPVLGAAALTPMLAAVCADALELAG